MESGRRSPSVTAESCMFSVRCSRRLGLTSVLLPVQPAASVLCHVLIAHLLRQLCGSTTPDTTLAVEDDLLVSAGLLEAESIFELVCREEHGVWLGFDGDIDGGGDVARAVFGWLTDVWEMLGQATAG